MRKFHAISSDGIRVLGAASSTINSEVRSFYKLGDHALLLLPATHTQQDALTCLRLLKEYIEKDIAPAKPQKSRMRKGERI